MEMIANRQIPAIMPAVVLTKVGSTNTSMIQIEPISTTICYYVRLHRLERKGHQ